MSVTVADASIGLGCLDGVSVGFRSCLCLMRLSFLEFSSSPFNVLDSLLCSSMRGWFCLALFSTTVVVGRSKHYGWSDQSSQPGKRPHPSVIDLKCLSTLLIYSPLPSCRLCCSSSAHVREFFQAFYIPRASSF